MMTRTNEIIWILGIISGGLAVLIGNTLGLIISRYKE